MSTEITKPAGMDLATMDGFAHAQRVAKMFASSLLVPEQWRGEARIADCAIALTLAAQLGESPLAVLQSLYVVNGKAGWAASYVIARANKSGVFKGRLNWRESGAGEGLSVTCFATLADSGEEVSATVSMAMAVAEGWARNPKYKSMPALMLRYRSATMLVRLYAGDVMLGLRTEDELVSEPEVAEPIPVADRAARIRERHAKALTVVAEPAEPAPQPEPAAGPATGNDFSELRRLVAIVGEGSTPAHLLDYASDPEQWSALNDAARAMHLARMASLAGEGGAS